MDNTANKINATPTKNFFITMLIRDLTLRDAIGDLVDNSVDGARSLDTEQNEFHIKIIANPNEFIIEDNCGGIDVNTARNYAFRFGRPDDMPTTPGSIGQFGIGMKRALFKLGNSFTVTSIAEKSTFEMSVNVSKWATEKDWDFKFKDYKEDIPSIDISKRGTKILVTNLREDVKAQFADNNFIKKLIAEIELENLYNLYKGISISINGKNLNSKNLQLINNDKIKTAYWQHKFENGVNCKIFAGIADKSLEKGGWYIFCNDRLIVGPDQTGLTGWTGGRSSDGGPKYHGQFERFRGYVFFEADDSSLLPWNTTKNYMDVDSPVFITVRQKMIQMMKPVISFLNKLKEERENDSPVDERELNNLIESSNLNTLTNVENDIDNNTAPVFSFPAIASPRKQSPNQNKITYLMEKQYVEKVKKNLNVNSLKEVGELTFKYYYDMEVGD